MALDLNEPLGWTFSSFRNILHPAAREREADSTKGVCTHGVLKEGWASSKAMLPMIEDLYSGFRLVWVEDT